MARQKTTFSRWCRVRGRRLIRRMEGALPGWLEGAMPWATSLTVHVLILVLSAIFVLGPRRDGASELVVESRFAKGDVDLTSLAEGDKAGDPFTDLDSAEPPSLPLDLDHLDSKATNLPELPPNFRLGPDVRLAPPTDVRPDVSTAAKGGRKFKPGDASLTAPFSGRQGAARAKLARREGGTVASEKAVDLGLSWIVRHQREDGGWSLAGALDCCENPNKPLPHIHESDTAAVGLALLPMLGAGGTHKESGPYQDSIDRGLKWLLRHQKRNGDLWIGGSMHTHIYSHAIATMALCEAYGITRDKALREPAQRAVIFIQASRAADGKGWRYEPGDSGDTSVFGWQLMALRSARLAGLAVSKKTIKDCGNYLNLASIDPHDRTLYSYLPGGGPSPTMTAEALLCRQYFGWTPKNRELVKGVGLVSAHLARSNERNIYYWYYATQLLHNMGGKAWVAWNERVRDGLVSMQVDGGHAAGSWDPTYPQPDVWGERGGGRLFLTSLSILTLEVYYRYLPLYRTDSPLARLDSGNLESEGSEPSRPGRKVREKTGAVP